MWFQNRLACPDCRAPLARAGEDFACPACARRPAARLPLDLTPQRPAPRAFAFSALSQQPERHLAAMDLTTPKPAYDGPMPGRDSRELLSFVAAMTPRPKTVLDLGCGPRDQAAPFMHLGMDYVGLDRPGTAADIFGDAHFLPFREASFDLVFAYAVLEHLFNPHLAAQEIRRVLRPGGVFLGTVSQGEPFHASYFHLTPWGLVALAEAASLELVRLWPGPDALVALSEMGRYPRAIKAALGGIAALDRAAPFLAPRRMRWSEREQRLDALYRAGSICFALRAS
jgi:SAM-dependent methyltransferase